MSQPFTLPDLPYDGNVLAPTISAQTVGLHHDKHHAAYFNMLNTLSVIIISPRFDHIAQLYTLLTSQLIQMPLAGEVPC